MRRPGLGEANLGAMAGAVVGGIAGLFALGIVPAIARRDPSYLVGMPILGLASLAVCGVVGWWLGGQTGPRVGALFHSQKAELVGGGLGGLIPVFFVALFGWYMTR